MYTVCVDLATKCEPKICADENNYVVGVYTQPIKKFTT